MAASVLRAADGVSGGGYNRPLSKGSGAHRNRGAPAGVNRVQEPATASRKDERDGRQISLKAVLIAAGAIAAFFGAVGFVLYFKPGGKDLPTDQPALTIFAAGPDQDFPRDSATYFEKEHFYLVRQSDGTLLALYDLSPSAQAGVQRGDETALDCRLRLINATSGASDNSAKSFGSDGLRDPCSGAIWDMSGGVMGDAAAGDLDRFPVEVINNIVRVDLGARRCLNEISDTAPCIETQ